MAGRPASCSSQADADTRLKGARARTNGNFTSSIQPIKIEEMYLRSYKHVYKSGIEVVLLKNGTRSFSV